MPNTYTQLYIHFVFAVRFRAAQLLPAWDEEVRRYITGIVQNHDHKLIAINNVSDHMHLFVGLDPKQSLSALMQHVKGDSSAFINERQLLPQLFRWQEGYAAFSHSRSQVDAVVKYIAGQQAYHDKVSFGAEYRKMLTDAGIEWDQRYVFRDPE